MCLVELTLVKLTCVGDMNLVSCYIDVVDVYCKVVCERR